MTRYLGVDCGLSGTLAIVETINGVPALIDAVDMPSTGTGAKARVDIIAAAPWIAKLARSTAYIERAQVFPDRAHRLDSPTIGPSAPSRPQSRFVDSHDLGRGFGLEAPAPSSRQR